MPAEERRFHRPKYALGSQHILRNKNIQHEDDGRNAYIQAARLEVISERIASQKLQVLAVVAVILPRGFVNLDARCRLRSKVVHNEVKDNVVHRSR